MTQPEFLTNEDNYTVSDGINSLLNHLSKSSRVNLSLDISTAYINPGGFSLISESLEKMDEVRLLLGTDPDIFSSKLRPLNDKFSNLESSNITRALEGQKRSMEEDRNLLGFSYHMDELAKNFVKWLRSGKVKVRRYEKGFLHGKAWILSNPISSVIAGSSNFTFAGLTTNIELNLGNYQPSVVENAQEWYNKIWEESDDFDLANLYSSRFEEHSPYLIYLRMLWEKYGSELEEEKDTPEARINLTSFQEDGVARARRILARHNGVLVADGVGLGKSFIAAALMREFIVEQRQRVLLIAPAALRDGPWRAFQNRHADFHFECISFEQLRDEMDPLKNKSHISNSYKEYALVVIDEAHGFRNPDTDRANALRTLLQGLPAKKLVLLTATPVNNSIWDLYYELCYFLRNDTAFAAEGIKSIREHFKDISNKNPDDLSPRDLFDILDQVAVRRTRNFIKEYYTGSVINIDGVNETIQFPKPNVERIDYDLKKVLPDFFYEFKESLDSSIRDSTTFRIPEEKIGIALSLARYTPSSYLLKNSLKPNEVQISGLLMSGLLKRFESSSFAFFKSCDRMIRAHDAFIEALDKGIILQGDNLVEWMSSDTDDIDVYYNQTKKIEFSKSYNIPLLKKSVEADKILLQKWAANTKSVSAEKDPKLEKLVEDLEKISEKAHSDGLTEQDKRNNQKTIIFSYYKDTVQWIYDYLIKVSKTDPRLSKFKNRITMVTGENTDESSVLRFAPLSTESPNDEDLFDILVCTDVLSEGVNLQQARNIINYDLPWNPMKLVQRHGRIDRIGSPHKRVFLKCFFPDKELDELLGLEKLLKIKIAAATAGVGVENEVLPSSQTVEVNFTETRKEIEKIRNENPELFENGGEKDSAVSGEEYRQYLRKGIHEPQKLNLIKDIAWGSGSGKDANGSTKGYVFCAKIGNKSEPIFRFISYENEEKPEVISDTLSCLSHAYSEEITPRKLDNNTYLKAYDAWSIAKRDIFEKWEFLTHPKNIQPKIPKAMRDSISILRKTSPVDMDQKDIENLINSLESDYGIRVQRRLREAIESAKNDQERSNQIASTVKEIGLEPPIPPKPLAQITEEDINLLCWIAIN